MKIEGITSWGRWTACAIRRFPIRGMRRFMGSFDEFSRISSRLAGSCLCVEELRDALAALGITLPALRPTGLVVLGSCTAGTARMLAAALRGDCRAAIPSAVDVRILAVPGIVPDLRRSVRRYLGAPCTDVQLCVTELVVNVIRHVGEGIPVRVRVARTACGPVRVEVTDPDPRALPVLVRATGDDEAGRGLALLDAVALRWASSSVRRARRSGARCVDRGPLPRTRLGRGGSPSAPPRPIPVRERSLFRRARPWRGCCPCRPRPCCRPP